MNITCRDFGLNVIRLGNKLFFYSFLIGLSEKFNRKIILPDYYLWKYLKTSPIISDLTGIVEFSLPSDSYDENFVNIFFQNNQNNLINVNAYCQSELSFSDYKEKVFELLTFKDEYVDSIKRKYSDFFDKPTIGIGVRLGGDMVGNSCFYQIPINWYIDSLNLHFSDWEENYNVIIFSDDINQSKEIFKNYNFKYSDSNDTHQFIIGIDNSEKGMEHLILGSLMNHFIISQSTFSWWQAWLSNNNPSNKYGKVIHTGRNFDGHFLNIMKNKDYYPLNWIEHKLN
jgi:hypothetical protein